MTNVFDESGNILNDINMAIANAKESIAFKKNLILRYTTLSATLSSDVRIISIMPGAGKQCVQDAVTIRFDVCQAYPRAKELNELLKDYCDYNRKRLENEAEKMEDRYRKVLEAIEHVNDPI